MSKLLINESPLILLPSLACMIGLPESIVLQQIHYLTLGEENRYVIQHDGNNWIKATYEYLNSKFPFWSAKTVRRAIDGLIEKGLLVREFLSENPTDRTSYYRVNIEQLGQMDVDNLSSEVDNLSKTMDKMSTSLIYNKEYKELNKDSKQQAVAKKPVQKNQTSVEKPASVDDQVWNDFLQHRKAKRATVTQTALNAIEREAQKANVSLQTALEEVILRGWQGFKAEWYLKDQQSASKPAPNANRAITKNADIHARNKAVADEFIRKMREEEAMKLNNGDLIDD